MTLMQYLKVRQGNKGRIWSFQKSKRGSSTSPAVVGKDISVVDPADVMRVQQLHAV